MSKREGSKGKATKGAAKGKQRPRDLAPGKGQMVKVRGGLLSSDSLAP